MLQTWNKKELQVVFHIPVPVLINNSGISYRTAIKQNLETKGPIISLYPNTSASELSQIQNGEIYEVVKYVSFSKHNLSSGEKAIEIDNYFNKYKIEFLEKKKIELEWWGLNRDVT
jgi:hypothetical protein